MIDGQTEVEAVCGVYITEKGLDEFLSSLPEMTFALFLVSFKRSRDGGFTNTT